jgi:iron complex outermembrane recepter protein
MRRTATLAEFQYILLPARREGAESPQWMRERKGRASGLLLAVLPLFFFPEFTQATQEDPQGSDKNRGTATNASETQSNTSRPATGEGAGVRVTLPATDLLTALDTLARQHADTQLIYRRDQLQGIRTPAIDAILTTQQAIEKLIEGTQLQLTTDATTGAMLIAPRAHTTSLNRGYTSLARDGRGTEDEGFQGPSNTGPIRLAQNAGNPATGDRRGAAGEETSVEPTRGANDNSPDQAATARGPISGKLDEVIVTGTHIRTAQDVAAPSMTFTREDLEKTGFAELNQLFAKLPQNLNEISAGGKLADGVSQVARSSAYVSGISLRGLGPGSTLVLLNGRRKAGSVEGRVVDISSIPLSAVDRVEVVTGGRSAVYGSDAVAGVVNLVTRRDFRGAETQLEYGGASAGGERLQFSQIYGADLARGGFIAAYDYSRGKPLDLTRTGVPRTSGSGTDLIRYDIRPDTERHSALLSGKIDLTDRVQLYADGLYTSYEHEAYLIYKWGVGNSMFDSSRLPSDQYSIAPGITIGLNDWTLDLGGNYSVSDSGVDSMSGSFTAPDPFESKSRAVLSSVSAVMEGPLFALRGQETRAAIGVEGRSERLKSSAEGLVQVNRDRRVRSAFVELLVPLGGATQRIDLSLAGRHDDYDDFGDTFNPQLGLVWSPNEQWTLRAAYAEAFRAPDLFTLDYRDSVLLRNLLDPTAGPTARTPTLLASGGNPNLQPEEATTWSAGFDYTPSFAPWARFSLSYIEIDYEGRIDQPAVALADKLRVLTNEHLYPGLINRSPTSAEVAQILAAAAGVGNLTGIPFNRNTQDATVVFPNLVLFDNRQNNIGLEKVGAIDFIFDGRFPTRVGNLSFGLNATYSREHERNVTRTSPAFSMLNAPGKPADLRFRANAGWQRSSWGAFLYVNYVDRYTDTLAVTPREVASWTTVDLTLRWDTAPIVDGGLFDDLAFALSFDNLFDRDPPLFLSNSFGLGYDGVNADAVGRYISLRAVKRWRD